MQTYAYSCDPSMHTAGLSLHALVSFCGVVLHLRTKILFDIFLLLLRGGETLLRINPLLLKPTSFMFVLHQFVSAFQHLETIAELSLLPFAKGQIAVPRG